MVGVGVLLFIFYFNPNSETTVVQWIAFVLLSAMFGFVWWALTEQSNEYCLECGRKIFARDFSSLGFSEYQKHRICEHCTAHLFNKVTRAKARSHTE